MKPKRDMIPGLTIGQNYRVAMSEEGLTFDRLSKEAGIPNSTVYRIVERLSPKNKTRPVVKLGKALGFTERQIEDKITQDRLSVGRAYSRKEAFYRALNELVRVFESKGC